MVSITLIHPLIQAHLLNLHLGTLHGSSQICMRAPIFGQMGFRACHCNWSLRDRLSAYLSGCASCHIIPIYYGGREGSGRSGQGRSKKPLRPTEKPMRPLVGRFGLVTKPKRFGPPICRSGLIEITLLQHPSMLYPIIAISRVQHQCPLQSVIHPRTSTKYQHYTAV